MTPATVQQKDTHFVLEIENPHDDGHTAGSHDKLIDSSQPDTSSHDNHSHNLGQGDKIDL